MKNDLKKMTNRDLRELSSQIDNEISNREYLKGLNRIKSVEELVKLFEGRGYVISPGNKFWQTPTEGYYGLEVGSYIHSCHCDTTHIKVLLVIDNSNLKILTFPDYLLKNCRVV